MKKSNPVFNILTAIFAVVGGCAAVLSGFIVLHAFFVGDFSATDAEGKSVSSEAALIQESSWPEEAAAPVTRQEETPGLELAADTETAAVEDESEVRSSEEQQTEKTENTENTISLEYYQALNRANAYSDTMHMLKADIYDRLVSEYGDNFSADAAQYAIDHITNDWESEAEVPESVQTGEVPAADSVETDNTLQTETSVIAGTDDTSQSADSVMGGTYSAPGEDVSMPVDTMVWLSATGEKYHSINNCGRMNPARARQVTLEEAVSRGFGQCKNCY